MEYDFEAIGKRIRKNRKKLGYTQEDFALMLDRNYVPIKRQTYIDIELGRLGRCHTFDLALMNALCKEFDCDMGYLLCEPGYEDDEARTRATIDVMDHTGLSAEAVNTLEKLKASVDDKTALDMLDFCLSTEGGDYIRMLMDQVGKFFGNADNKDKLGCLMKDADVLKIIQGILTLLRDDFIKSHTLGSLNSPSDRLRVYHTIDRDTAPSNYAGLPEGTKQFIRDIAKEYDLQLPDDDFSQASRDIVAKFCKEHPDAVSNYIANMQHERESYA